jgi:hypothetical protein
MAVWRSEIFDRIDRPVDQKLCSERNTGHCYRMVRSRHDTACRRSIGTAAAFRTWAIGCQHKSAEISTAGCFCICCGRR